MFNELIDRLLAYPQKAQIKIDFDAQKKTFLLSVPIFTSVTMPESVKNYIDARKNSTFKPHVTTFQIDGDKVYLIQEFPFKLDFQATLRKQVDHFLQMSRRCRRMLTEIAVEEKYKNALNLDSHFDA